MKCFYSNETCCSHREPSVAIGLGGSQISQIICHFLANMQLLLQKRDKNTEARSQLSNVDEVGI